MAYMVKKQIKLLDQFVLKYNMFDVPTETRMRNVFS